MTIEKFMKDAHYKGYLAHYVWDSVNEIFEKKIRAEGNRGDNSSEKPTPVTPSSHDGLRVQEPLKEVDKKTSQKPPGLSGMDVKESSETLPPFPTWIDYNFP